MTIAVLQRAIPLGIGLALGVVLVKFWNPTAADPAAPGTTYGTIIVSSPEVYSRERLVNDRFQEATWLASELRDIDKLTWGSEASVASSHEDAGRLALDVAQQSDGPHTPPPGGVTDSTPTSQSWRQGGAEGGAQSSPIERFRDRLAYREEVRAASLETQLDDRHDIAGNTLYRVKFSVTILPEPDTSAWALVYAELKEGDNARDQDEIYPEWLAYYEDQLNKDLERASDSTRSYPEKLNSFSRYVATVLREECKGDHDCERQLEAQTIARQKQLEDAERNEYAIHVLRCAPPGTSGAALPPCDRDALNDLEARCNSPSLPASACAAEPTTYQRLDALLEQYRAIHYKDVPEQSRPRPRQFLREVTAHYLLWGLDEYSRSHPGPPLWQAKVVDCEIGLCGITLKNAGDAAAQRFKNEVRADQVFAYAVSPRESVQRISTLASAQRARQLALQTSLASEVPAKLGMLLEQNQKDDSLLQAILRKPLIVGFAPPGAESRRSIRDPGVPTSSAPTGDDIATFGWILGPRFDISQSSMPRFRHAASENDVSAIISVPSWWKSATLTMTTCWVDEREVRSLHTDGSGIDLYVACKNKSKEDQHTIRLPRALSEIARKLELEVVRRPSVSRELQSTGFREYEADQPADFLILGNHLWRSTVVTLDGMPADNIIVLPNMKGIVARFNKIPPLPAGVDRKVSMMFLFTSEGYDFVDPVNIVRHAQVPPNPPAAQALAVTRSKKEGG